MGLLFLKFGRDDEIQADRLGAEYAADGGWHPEGVADMLSTLGRISEVSDRRGIPNWLSTHPEPDARVLEVGPTVESLLASREAATLTTDRSGYLDRIEGLQFGDNPEDGVVRGNEFLHAPLQFGLEFPEGWKVQNSDTVVVAQPPGQEVYMLLQLAERRRGADLQSLADDSMSGEGYRLVSGGMTTINGLEAYLGSYRRNVNNVGPVLARVAYIRHNQSVFVFGGLGPVEEFARVEAEVNRSIRSFRPLSQAEADRIVPNEIALYVAREGDTWQRIAQQGGEGIVEATTLAIMNGYPVNEQPLPGDRLKIVVPGQMTNALGDEGRGLGGEQPPRSDVPPAPIWRIQAFDPYPPAPTWCMHETPVAGRDADM